MKVNKRNLYFILIPSQIANALFMCLIILMEHENNQIPKTCIKFELDYEITRTNPV